jgi:hypothetical protein
LLLQRDHALLAMVSQRKRCSQYSCYEKNCTLVISWLIFCKCKCIVLWETDTSHRSRNSNSVSANNVILNN